MDAWVDGWVLCLNYDCCNTKSSEQIMLTVVIKILREEMRREQRSRRRRKDSNKLLIDDVSGGETLSFWSRIAARHIHQPRIVILYLIILLIVPTYNYLHTV